MIVFLVLFGVVLNIEESWLFKCVIGVGVGRGGKRIFRDGVDFLDLEDSDEFDFDLLVVF